jgi:hypothetical protein
MFLFCNASRLTTAPIQRLVRNARGCLHQAAGTWSWTLASNECRSLERVELHLHCPIYLHSCTGTTLFSAYSYVVRQDDGATNQRIVHTLSESHFSLLANVVWYNPLSNGNSDTSEIMWNSIVTALLPSQINLQIIFWILQSCKNITAGRHFITLF